MLYGGIYLEKQSPEKSEKENPSQATGVSFYMAFAIAIVKQFFSFIKQVSSLHE
ncbi:hypothetical protein HNP72_002029 [Sphingobacterium soli]|nr:hypothetical protein [Sphingobacterium soli]